MASFEQYPEPPKEEESTGDERGGLKVVLGIAVVILIIVAVAVGVIVWRNSTLSTARQTDTEALTKGSAGVSDVSFSAVDIEGLPSYSSLYGKTVKQLKNGKGKLSYSSKLKKTSGFSGIDGLSSKQQKSIKYTSNATLSGNDAVTATLCFDKKKKLVAMSYSFDLDKLGVAEADFAVYAGDRTVPESIMKALGFSKGTIKGMELSTQDNSQAMKETSGLRSCTFSGKTGEKLKTVKKTKKVYNKKKHKKVKKVTKTQVQVKFMNWELTQSYRYGTSEATTRTATVSFW